MRGYCSCDIYEPNNDRRLAHPLGGPGTYSAYLCACDPDDWYFIDITAPVMVSLDLEVPAVADYDLYLYYHELQGVPERVAWSSWSGNGIDEHIDYRADVLGRYYIRVYPYRGCSDDQPYVLTLSY